MIDKSQSNQSRAFSIPKVVEPSAANSSDTPPIFADMEDDEAKPELSFGYTVNNIALYQVRVKKKLSSEEFLDIVASYRQNKNASIFKDVKLKPNQNLQGTDLSKLPLNNFDFDGANLDNANLTGANLTGANLSMASLRGARLTSTNLEKTRFYEADLTRAKIDNADIKYADFSFAKLHETDFSHSNIFGIDLTGSSLAGTIFNNATIYDNIYIRDTFDDEPALFVGELEANNINFVTSDQEDTSDAALIKIFGQDYRDLAA